MSILSALKVKTDFVSITDFPLLSTNKCSYFEVIFYKAFINLTYYLACLFAFLFAKVLISQKEPISSKCLFLFSNFAQYLQIHNGCCAYWTQGLVAKFWSFTPKNTWLLKKPASKCTLQNLFVWHWCIHLNEVFCRTVLYCTVLQK